MSFFASKKYQRVANFAFAAILVISTFTASVPFLFSKTANAVGTTSVCAGGCNAATLQAAIDTAANGDVLSLAGNVTAENQVTIDKPLTLEGNGHSISPTFALPSPLTGKNNAALGIEGTTGVIVNDLVVDGTNGTKLNGIDAFKATASLNNVVTKNNKKYGLIVNGSNVTVNNITTANNAWGGIDVDIASTANPAQLTIDGTSHHSEFNQVFMDNSTKAVSIVDTNSQYMITSIGNARLYTLKVPTAAPTHLQFNYKDANEVDQTLACGGIINSNKAKIWHESGSLNLNWTAPTGTVTGYQVDVTGPTGSYINYGGPNAWSWIQFTQGDGTYTYSVRANSAGGLSQPSVSCSIVYDHTAPVVTVSPVAGSLLHGTETFNISVADANLNSAASHVYVYLYNNGGTQKSKGTTVDLSSGHATFTVDTTKLDDGLASFDVGRFADAAGNFTGTGDTYFRNYHIDNTIPNAPTGLFFSANGTTLTNLTVNSVLNNKIVLGWTDPTNSPSGIIQHITEVDGPNGYTNQFWNGYPNTWLNANGGEFGQHGDGAYTYKVKVENAAGTWSDWSAPLTLIYDTMDPTATIDGHAPVALYGASTNINVHAIDANYLQTDLYLNGAATPFKTYTGTYFGLFWLADGNYRMVVRDKATNSQEYDFTIDKTAPAAPVVSATGLTSGQSTKSGSVEVTWTKPSSDTVKYDYRVWTNISTSSYKSEASAYIDYSLTGNSRVGAFTEGQGSYFVQVRAYDAAGNVSPWSNTFTVIYDTTAPTVAITSPVNGSTFGNGSQVTIAGSTGDAASYTLSIGKTGETPLATAAGTSFTSYVWDTSAVVSGNYIATLTGTDAAGNSSTSEVVITIDNTAPTLTVAPQTDTTGNQPTITGTVNDPTATLTVIFNGGAPVAVANNGGAFSFTVPAPLADGNYLFTIKATDAHGNVSSQNANVVVKTPVAGSPTTTNVTPLEAVLGATTEKAATDTGVKGATDTKTADAVSANANMGIILGLAWYWWILILAALAAIIWYIIAAIRRRNETQA